MTRQIYAAAAYVWDVVTCKGKRFYDVPMQYAYSMETASRGCRHEVLKHILTYTRTIPVNAGWISLEDWRHHGSPLVVLVFDRDVGAPDEVNILWDSEYDRF